MTYWKDGEKTEANSMLLSFNKIWGGGTEVNNDLIQSLSKLAKHSKMFTNGLGKAEDGKARCHDRISNNDGKPTFSPTIAESRTSQDAQKRQRAFFRPHCVPNPKIAEIHLLRQLQRSRRDVWKTRHGTQSYGSI